MISRIGAVLFCVAAGLAVVEAGLCPLSCDQCLKGVNECLSGSDHSPAAIKKALDKLCDQAGGLAFVCKLFVGRMAGLLSKAIGTCHPAPPTCAAQLCQYITCCPKTLSPFLPPTKIRD